MFNWYNIYVWLIDEMKLRMFNCLNVEKILKKSYATTDGHFIESLIDINKIENVSCSNIETMFKKMYASDSHLSKQVIRYDITAILLLY